MSYVIRRVRSEQGLHKNALYHKLSQSSNYCMDSNTLFISGAEQDPLWPRREHHAEPRRGQGPLPG
jgi:hypothetical protein